MSSISYTVGLDTSKFTGALSMMRKGIGGVGSAFGAMGKMLPVGGLIAGIGGITGAMALLKKASNVAADFESTSLAIRTLVGDADKAKTVIEQIEQLASQTPFEFPELASTGKMLISFGESTGDVADTLRRIGDVASGIQAPIADLAQIYGQARTSQTLYTTDILQLAGRGVPAFELLASVMNKSTDQIRDLASEGKITFPILEQAFIDLTSEGGKFFGMMATQSASTNGLLSTLNDGWTKLLRIAGTQINDWLRPQLQGWITNLDKAGVRLSALIQLLKGAQQSGNLGEFIGASLTLGAVKMVNTIAGGIRGIGAFLMEAVPGAFAVGIGLIRNSGLDTFFAQLFAAGGQALKAAMYRAISAIPGLEDYGSVSDSAGEAAASMFRIAGYDLQDAIKSMPGAIAIAAKELGVVANDAMKAATTAGSDPLINESNAQNKFDQIAKGINLQNWRELVTGETKRQVAVAETKKKADGLDAALKAVGNSAEKTKTKLTNGLFGNGGEAFTKAARPLRQIFMKKLRDGDGGGFVPGPDGTFIPRAAAAIQNKGRNEFGKNRPARENRPPKNEAVDPLTRILTEIKETNRRLEALGLAS